MRPLPGPLVLGHRGSPKEARENTLESLALALRSGADGVEMDVQRSREGHPVVIHDDEMSRVWGIQRSISALDWPAIERLTNARLPDFAQVAAWAAASGAWLNVELKTRDVEAAVIEILREMGLGERVVISSFDAEILAAAGRADPRLRRFLLTERWDITARRGVASSDAVGVCLRVDSATRPILDDLRDRGLPVIVWTVNDSAEVRRLLEEGVAAIISDHPAMAARERDAFLDR